MGFLFAIFIGIFVATNFDNVPLNTQQEEKTIQVDTKKTVKNNTAIPEIKSQAKDAEPIKEEIKSQVKEDEPIKEEIKSQVKEAEPIKEEIKSQAKEAEPIKEEIKSEPKEVKPIKEEVTEIVNLEEAGTDWLKLILLALGAIFVVGSGTYLYNRTKNNSSSSSSNDYMRSKFKEKTQPETQEQQPSQEETQPETQEQQPSQEETQVQESTEEDENNKK